MKQINYRSSIFHSIFVMLTDVSAKSPNISPDKIKHVRCRRCACAFKQYTVKTKGV